MIHRIIHIKEWKIDMFIDDGGALDNKRVADCLFYMGATQRIINRSLEMINSARPNEAFTYSNGKHTCIYIGWTTSGAEFINSFVHELRHLVDHIASYYGIGNGEAVGYISGEAAFMLASDICRLGCPNCTKHYQK